MSAERSPREERELSYFAKFRTKHPNNAQVLAWAQEIFPGITLKLHTGMFQCQVKQGAKTIIRHLKRTALMSNGGTVLGVGTDAVEAVAAADIKMKTLKASREAKTTQQPQKDPTP